MFVANRKLVFQYLKEPSVIVENRITLQQKVGENLITICCQIFPHHAFIPSLLPLLSITLYFYCKLEPNARTQDWKDFAKNQHHQQTFYLLLAQAGEVYWVLENLPKCDTICNGK